MRIIILWELWTLSTICKNKLGYILWPPYWFNAWNSAHIIPVSVLVSPTFPKGFPSHQRLKLNRYNGSLLNPRVARPARFFGGCLFGKKHLRDWSVTKFISITKIVSLKSLFLKSARRWGFFNLYRWSACRNARYVYVYQAWFWLICHLNGACRR